MNFLFYPLLFSFHTKCTCKLIKYKKKNKDIIDKIVTNMILNFTNDRKIERKENQEIQPLKRNEGSIIFQ